MTIHPHDTDRILGVLGDAITKLRVAHDDYQWADILEAANDLALLHGAVSAERDKADEFQRLAAALVESNLVMADTPKLAENVITPASPRRAALRLVKREEISDEVMRGEHRDD